MIIPFAVAGLSGSQFVEKNSIVLIVISGFLSSTNIFIARLEQFRTVFVTTNV